MHHNSKTKNGIIKIESESTQMSQSLSTTMKKNLTTLKRNKMSYRLMISTARNPGITVRGNPRPG